MPRLPYVDPDSATGPAKEIFDGPLKGKHFNIFKSMANSPAALKLYLKMNEALADSSLTDAQKETVQLVVGQANGCDYCLAAHTAIAKGAGLSEDQTVAARQGRVEGDEKLDAVARFAAALVEKKGYVSDDDVRSFKSAGFDDGNVADVVGVFALATYTNYFNHVNGTDVDFPAAPKL